MRSPFNLILDKRHENPLVHRLGKGLELGMSGTSRVVELEVLLGREHSANSDGVALIALILESPSRSKSANVWFAILQAVRIVDREVLQADCEGLGVLIMIIPLLPCVASLCTWQVASPGPPRRVS